MCPPVTHLTFVYTFKKEKKITFTKYDVIFLLDNCWYRFGNSFESTFMFTIMENISNENCFARTELSGDTVNHSSHLLAKSFVIRGWRDSADASMDSFDEVFT